MYSNLGQVSIVKLVDVKGLNNIVLDSGKQLILDLYLARDLMIIFLGKLHRL